MTDTRLRVMICCSSTEVVKIIEPAKIRRIDRVHILSNILDKNETEEDRRRIALYQEFYDENVHQLEDLGVEIVSHQNAPIFGMDPCMGLIYDIILEEKEKGSIISIDLEGPLPYAVASTVVSMTFDDVEIFNVGVPSDGHVNGMARDSYVHDGRLVGTAFKITRLHPLNGFPIEKPDEYMLKALKVFDAVPINKRSNVNVIRNLIINHLWKPSENEDDPIKGTFYELEDPMTLKPLAAKNIYSKSRTRDTVSYQRRYISYWLDQGWIRKSDINQKRYELTEKGRRYLTVFCPKRILDIDTTKLMLRWIWCSPTLLC